MSEDFHKAHNFGRPSESEEEKPEGEIDFDIEPQIIMQGDDYFESDEFDRPAGRYIKVGLVALTCVLLVVGIVAITLFPDEVAELFGRPPSIEELREEQGLGEIEGGTIPPGSYIQPAQGRAIEGEVSRSQVERKLAERNEQRSAEYPGAFFVTIEPWNCLVTFDGKTQPVENTFSVSDLLPGTYTLVVSKEGYESRSLEVVVEANKISDVGRIELQRLP